jgi:enolase
VSPQVSELRLRGIWDSRGEWTAEADVTLDGEASGRGSSPRAIAPGQREARRSATARELDESAAQLTRHLHGESFDDQRAIDDLLAHLCGLGQIGADATLAVSLAFCRASCAAEGTPLHRHLAELAGTEPALPHPLVNVFSGGVHLHSAARDFQQIMIVPRAGSAVEELACGVALFGIVEERVSAGPSPLLSASSGLIVEGATSEQLLRRLAEARPLLASVALDFGLAVDVAAEHLRTPEGTYRLGREKLDGADLLARLTSWAEELPLAYVEDPFAPEDEHLWRDFTERVGRSVCVVGDDLFATNAGHVMPGLANAILLKFSQAGTVTATLDAANVARAHGLDLCVSHRSGETEDTAMCDLAVAVGARFIKVGGPRRGDRLAKYNHLLRLAEEFNGEPRDAPAPERLGTPMEVT